MKLILLSSLFVLAFVLLVIPQAFAISELKPGSNTLENTELHGESATISLDIQFGEDEYQELLTRTIVKPQLESISLSFYGDDVSFSEPKLRVVGEGRHFRISSLVDGIIIYGHKNIDVGNYKINILFITDKGFQKFTVSTAAHIDDDVVIKPEIKESTYTPELVISSSHDFKTFWKDNFDIDIRTFDGNINPSATGFDGKLNGVDITVLISLDGENITTLKGVTENGVWEGQYYIQDNITQAGEYDIDVLASYNGQKISKSSTMFIVGEVKGDGGSGTPP